MLLRIITSLGGKDMDLCSMVRLQLFFYRQGSFDSAAKLYEKVCALYSGEEWQSLLAEVLPNLAECQRQLETKHTRNLSAPTSSSTSIYMWDRSFLFWHTKSRMQSK